jgi:predicted enzyme related to lactoylglutathione lyase
MTARLLRSRTTIGVRSVPEAIAFYERVAGFEVVVIMGEPPTFALVGTGDVGLGLVKSAAPPVADFVCCYVDVVGVEDLHQRCVDAGASITSPLTRRPWGNHDFVIADPDGNQIAFGEVPT